MAKNKQMPMSEKDMKNSNYSTWLPEPTTLEKYKNIIPDGADRIMSMFENEQENRHKVENKSIDNMNSQTKRGQWLGFIMGLITLGCGTYLTIIGERAVGGTLFSVTVIGLVGVFVIGKFYYPNKSA
ncbi:DUF2335 domain-containing protein [Aureibaculum sp. A20]|uniref:DUF2335 domain-containing protein n=1 Tax=Aureibaculum flavum TaxID=2795986 RepID=A0ABS0WSH8_9FLAO|nr:DUF2335 domain-containing protein [Aureibaculum flavum]MBJ2174935.1 DUF2335 domain-containing protein [Aureibaculum flavum]